MESITECYLASIKLDGSIFNTSWVNLCNGYNHLYEKENEKRKDKVLELLNEYEKQNKYHPNYLKVCYQYRDIINKEVDQLLIDGYKFAKEADAPVWVESILLILLFIKKSYHFSKTF